MESVSVDVNDGKLVHTLILNTRLYRGEPLRISGYRLGFSEIIFEPKSLTSKVIEYDVRIHWE